MPRPKARPKGAGQEDVFVEEAARTRRGAAPGADDADARRAGEVRFEDAGIFGVGEDGEALLRAEERRQGAERAAQVRLRAADLPRKEEQRVDGEGRHRAGLRVMRS